MNLSNFSEQDIETVINQVFSENEKIGSIEEIYQRLARVMCESFCTVPGESDLVLSRVYHSFDFPLLSSSLQQTAKQIWEKNLKENSKLIALMGTYGKEAAWQDRTQSKGHKAILLSHETLNNIPMVARLIQQIGFDLGILLGEKEKGIEYKSISGAFGVFYVSPALDSPYIPAQDFVKHYEVKSVLGTGVMLPQGDIGIYIGFSRVPIENEMAANIAPLMSLFWQRAFPLLEKCGMFT